LEAILQGVGVVNGEVIVPTNTFAATAFAVLSSGARPVFADIQRDLTIAVADVAARITSKTRAVVTVHVGGLISPATPSLAALCRERGVALIEDAAHAHGSFLNGMAAGTFGIGAAFSFFSTKVITTGEGGMVLSDEPWVLAAARLLRDHAKVRGANFHEVVGHSWRLTEIQAILGMAQLRRLDEFVAARRRVAAAYDELLAGVDRIQPLHPPEAVVHNRYKYVAFVSGIAPADLKARLKENHGVSLAGFVYDVPLHRQPVFREFADESLPVAEELCSRHVCLPIYPSLTHPEVDYVVDAIRSELDVRSTREMAV
jgi:perosamine synthetase